MFMCFRRLVKPECISALTERATARASTSTGHSCAAGNSSAIYSQIASESHTPNSPLINTGTNLEGEYFFISSGQRGSLNDNLISVKSMSDCFNTSHGRSDQEE